MTDESNLGDVLPWSYPRLLYALAGTLLVAYAAWNASDLNGDTRDALRELTELYEQATFAPDSIDIERASRALAHADEFLSAGMVGRD